MPHLVQLQNQSQQERIMDSKIKPLSATTLATFHTNNCELFLQFKSNLRHPLHLSSDQRENIEDYKDAILNKGVEWERNLKEKMERDGILLDLGGDPHNFLKGTIDRMRSSSSSHFYVYGTVFEGPQLKEGEISSRYFDHFHHFC